MYDEFNVLAPPKIVIILAPNNAESLPKAGAAYEVAKKNIKDFYLYLSPLNSLKYMPADKVTSPKPLDNPWAAYIKFYKESVHNHGKWISMSERAKLQDLMIEVMRSVVIPRIESRLKVLHGKLQPKKTGFFGRESIVETPTLDQDLRQGADLAFLFQDYYNATVYYGKLYGRLMKKQVTQFRKQNRKEQQQRTRK